MPDVHRKPGRRGDNVAPLRPLFRPRPGSLAHAEAWAESLAALPAPEQREQLATQLTPSGVWLAVCQYVDTVMDEHAVLAENADDEGNALQGREVHVRMAFERRRDAAEHVRRLITMSLLKGGHSTE